jgi:glutamyl-tRNA reductase
MSGLKIGVLGLSHKTANLAFREEAARGANALAGERALFFPHPMILLSTCNRTEIYFSAHDLSEAHSDLLAWLRRYMEWPFEHRLYSFFGIDCFAHLARVTAGLDSAIVAESEIQRQVKVAYETAAKLMELPACVHYVFQKALKVGKQVRRQFAFTGGALTLCRAVWEIANTYLDVTRAKILLIGYSEINRGMAQFLAQRGVSEMSLVTRTPSRVSLAGCTTFGRSELARVSSYDLVIAATHSDHHLIEGPLSSRPLIFDLSVPRNVDPLLGQKTPLYNIEMLHHWIEQKKALESNQLLQAADALVEHVERLSALYAEKTERLLISNYF